MFLFILRSNFQVKVVFDLFHLQDPDADGQCSTDFFLATGGSPVPQLCGINTDQHGNGFIRLAMTNIQELQEIAQVKSFYLILQTIQIQKN